jgi:hypothetical protein
MRARWRRHRGDACYRDIAFWPELFRDTHKLSRQIFYPIHFHVGAGISLNANCDGGSECFLAENASTRVRRTLPMLEG